MKKKMYCGSDRQVPEWDVNSIIYLPLIVCVDVSKREDESCISKAGKLIHELMESLRKDEMLIRCLDIMIVGYDQDQTIIQEFTAFNTMIVQGTPTIRCSNSTEANIFAALSFCIDRVEARKKEFYWQNGIEYCTPTIILQYDGETVTASDEDAAAHHSEIKSKHPNISPYRSNLILLNANNVNDDRMGKCLDLFSDVTTIHELQQSDIVLFLYDILESPRSIDYSDLSSSLLEMMHPILPIADWAESWAKGWEYIEGMPSAEPADEACTPADSAEAHEYRAVDPSIRLPIALCLDVSDSMRGGPIKQISQGVSQFIRDCWEDESSRFSCELMILTFSADMTVVLPFTNISELMKDGKLPEFDLEIGGSESCIGEAVLKCIDMLDDRKHYYQVKGTEHFQPWLVIMSVGRDKCPDMTAQEKNAMKVAEDRLKRLVAAKKLTVFSVCMDSSAEDGGTKNRLFPECPSCQMQVTRFFDFIHWQSLNGGIVGYPRNVPGKAFTLQPAADWSETWATVEFVVEHVKPDDTGWSSDDESTEE